MEDIFPQVLEYFCFLKIKTCGNSAWSPVFSPSKTFHFCSLEFYIRIDSRTINSGHQNKKFCSGYWSNQPTVPQSKHWTSTLTEVNGKSSHSSWRQRCLESLTRGSNNLIGPIFAIFSCSDSQTDAGCKMKLIISFVSS